VFWSPAVDEGAYAVSRRASCGPQRRLLVTDSSAFFSSDRIGVRVTLPVGFAWPHPSAVVRIGEGGS